MNKTPNGDKQLSLKKTAISCLIFLLLSLITLIVMLIVTWYAYTLFGFGIYILFVAGYITPLMFILYGVWFIFSNENNVNSEKKK